MEKCSVGPPVSGGRTWNLKQANFVPTLKVRLSSSYKREKGKEKRRKDFFNFIRLSRHLSLDNYVISL
ncbi:hypothetical protein ATY89_08960 [Sulfolobus acidocaldarius]|uniref:Uncharacterized protein n=3 Tax=Sulfolobus acidocaldarius TaxID=2285 RepID=M1J447_9CREN|nr:hypothetical protein SacN8_08940 [Sulfolobus acidocaldarius N8]AGE74021.1 hypothetical protein SacRon12I_08950 [Sulfolobus acidocaldarius Ron12/I]ALU30049.1 hypothetical protein ATY89_08960 [Sulfolobus acidocaldarius]WCM35639.1 hypothetical protein GO597_09995 [Sulfolobus acidocaldarius DSM 639]